MQRDTTEPTHIKLYVGAGRSILDTNPLLFSPLLHALLQHMSTADQGQRIVLNMAEAKQICKEIGISLPTYYAQIKRLVEADIIRPWNTEKPVWTGTFFVNPDMFGCGDWEDIRKLRRTRDCTLRQTDR